MKEHIARIEEVTAKMRNAEGEEKELLNREFWLLAIDAFNEHIAGSFTTVTGEVIETPKIEF